ncbi:DUF805 domain-containing protein [Philodulcilactobacillus myokoensis]|uniref:DUF805 domain-containing protein n=1 Tax=Philodulcilactobacillus myokoensis TaxID=2929573 RepID=UPI00403ACCB2
MNLIQLAIITPNVALLMRRLKDGGHSYGHIFWVFLPVIGWLIIVILACMPTDDSGHVNQNND